MSNLDSKYLGFKILHVSLIAFWISLLIAGIYKSYCIYYLKIETISTIHQNLRWVYISFLTSGIGIFLGVLLITIPILIKIKRVLIVKS